MGYWALTKGDDTVVPHEADQYEPAEELVAGYYEEPEDTQWW